MAKEKCRHQLVVVARELQKFRDAEAGRAEAKLEHMRLKYIAREHRMVLDGDRQQLKDIKQELDALRGDVSPTCEASASSGANAAHNNEVARLRSERETLLSSGVYHASHPLITRIDAAITAAQVEASS